MNVLHITTHFNTGGISNYILSLSKALAAKGVKTIVASSGGDLESGLEDFHIEHRYFDIKTKFEFGPKAIMSGFKAAGLVRREKIDLIHAHTRVSQVAASIASMITGVPYVTTCHGYFKKRSRGVIDTWGVKVIAISDAVRKHLKDDLDVDESRISLIYSGVDEARYSHDYPKDEINMVKKASGLKPGPVIGTIGRLSSVKGQKHLIMAMKEIMSRIPDAQCLIVGNGPEEASLRALARSMAVDGAVSFIESCADTHKYLSTMDLFVFPSIKEGLGIALLEALASGKACVASRIGGIEDIITDGVNGVLVDVGYPSGIAKASIRILEDDLLRKRLGEAGRALINARFTLNSMSDRIVILYKEVIGR